MCLEGKGGRGVGGGVSKGLCVERVIRVVLVCNAEGFVCVLSVYVVCVYLKVKVYMCVCSSYEA